MSKALFGYKFAGAEFNTKPANEMGAAEQSIGALRNGANAFLTSGGNAETALYETYGGVQGALAGYAASGTTGRGIVPDGLAQKLAYNETMKMTAPDKVLKTVQEHPVEIGAAGLQLASVFGTNFLQTSSVKQALDATAHEGLLTVGPHVLPQGGLYNTQITA